MCRGGFLVILTVQAMLWPRVGRAQTASLSLEPGTRLRVSGCVPVCGAKIKGELLRMDDEAMTLVGRDDTISVSLAEVSKVEIGTPYRFNGQRARRSSGRHGGVFGPRRRSLGRRGEESCPGGRHWGTHPGAGHGNRSCGGRRALFRELVHLL